MLHSVESDPGFVNLRSVVQATLDDGIHGGVLLEDLEQIRGLVSDRLEDMVLDVMDLLVGWCAPSAVLRRRTGESAEKL